MKTVKDALHTFKQELAGRYEANELASVTQLVLSTLTGESYARLRAFPEMQLTALQIQDTERIFNELKTGIPVQYALGVADFYGMTFKVDQNVLIPRPETEELVEWVLEECRANQLFSPEIIDIGTGSGCIAVAVKKNLINAGVSALDISEGALQVARQNAQINDVQIKFIQGDILNGMVEENISAKFNIIISNPPYVTQTDKDRMHQRVTDFEPHTALFVPQDNPLLFYDAIAGFAMQKLTDGGMLFFEINESLGKEIVELLKIKGLKNIQLRKDIFDRDRMIMACKT